MYSKEQEKCKAMSYDIQLRLETYNGSQFHSTLFVYNVLSVQTYNALNIFSTAGK